jgi:hypothetical protein
VSDTPIRDLPTVSLRGLGLFAFNLRHSASGGAVIYGSGNAWNELLNLAFYRPHLFAFVIGMALLVHLGYRSWREIACQKSGLMVWAAVLPVYLAAARVYGLGVPCWRPCASRGCLAQW